MVLAIEPMVNAGGPEVRVKDDGWTAVTTDGSRSAHFEHSVAVTDDGPYVLQSAIGAVAGAERSETRESSSISQAICKKCKIIRRAGVVRVLCSNPRHKQRQG